jgi:hypothetical protein
MECWERQTLTALVRCVCHMLLKECYVCAPHHLTTTPLHHYTTSRGPHGATVPCLSARSVCLLRRKHAAQEPVGPCNEVPHGYKSACVCVGARVFVCVLTWACVTRAHVCMCVHQCLFVFSSHSHTHSHAQATAHASATCCGAGTPPFAGHNSPSR